MKTVYGIILAILMTLSLVGCSGNTTSEQSVDSAGPQDSTESVNSEPTEYEEEKVALKRVSSDEGRSILVQENMTEGTDLNFVGIETFSYEFLYTDEGSCEVVLSFINKKYGSGDLVAEYSQADVDEFLADLLAKSEYDSLDGDVVQITNFGGEPNSGGMLRKLKGEDYWAFLFSIYYDGATAENCDVVGMTSPDSLQSNS